MPINSFLYPGVRVFTPYEVANSLRFDDGSSDNLTRTTDTPDNRDKFTVSAWIKLSSHASKNPIVAFYGSNDYCSLLYNDERIQFIVYDGGNIANISLTSRHRDFSAWYHIVLAVDSTQATASDRVKIYVNGVQETTLTDTSYPAQNADMIRSTMTTTAVGRSVDQLGTNFYCDGYLAEVVCIDNQQLTPTSFGEFDTDTGIWKPIDVSSLTFGTNGFYLDFENSGSLGADVSGNGNNFTVNNLTSIDQTTDTPTNNWCTMNPLITRSGTAATYSEGNLKVVWSHSVNVPTMGTIGVQSGKWYYESKMFWGSNSYIGITYDSTPTNTDVTGYLLRQTGQKYDAFTGSGSSYTSALSTGDTVMIAFDADNGTLWFGVNGTWSNSATQTEIENGTTTNAAFSSIDMSYIWLPMGKGGISSNARIEANFGNPIYTISSGNSDANGYGNFEYAVPSGYYALNSKNLAEFG